MAPELRNVSERPPHRHWSEDELFEFAAGLTSKPQEVECAECRTRLDAVGAGLCKLRSAAGDRRLAESALAERILAATVRENVDWRGDLRLVASFARERLRSSPWLRFAAALLFIHAAALPVLAWIVLRSESAAPHFFSSIEALPRESAFAEADDELALPLESGESGEPRLVELGAEDGAAKVRAAAEREHQAAVLRAFDWPQALDSARPDDALALRLWVRSRQATHGLTAPAAWAGERARWNGSDLDSEQLDLLALELEIELDRVARGADERPARSWCERWAPQLRSARSELAQWALARAALLGLTAADESDRDGARAGAPTISGSLFDPRWFEALGRALGAVRNRSSSSSAESALVQDWIARGERR